MPSKSKDSDELTREILPVYTSYWARSSLIRIFSVCYSEKHFVNSTPENQHLRTERE